ncbi:MAG: xylose isomerase [Clostridiales bacterium]|nr:xylose isomerase [Clostridiales bacterium]
MEQIFKIPAVRYEGAGSTNPFAYRFYNKNEIINGKTMGEHLRFAVSYWHTLCSEGADMFGVGTADKQFGARDEMELARRKADACFELLEKLDIDYFCFHDRDIAPEGETLAESNERLSVISDYILEKMKQTGKKCLWGTANCFSNPRYLHGAGTAPNADVFAFAAGQIKNNTDIVIKLGGEGIVFWGGREGYETLLNTNLGLEQDNMARLMRMTVDYARKKGFRGDFYIEPKPKEPSKHQYDTDVATVLAFLRKYGLDKDFKMNIEANHATLAGHTFQHELRVARENGVFGSIDANQGDLLLGWDTDQFPTNIYEAALCMYEVLKAGGFNHGGLNFDAKTRRGSFEHEDIFHGYIAGIDAFALGLRIAVRLIEDGRLDGFVRNRYSSWESGIGADIINGKVDLEDLSVYALKLGDIRNNTSGRQEYLENILNQVMFGNK